MPPSGLVLPIPSGSSKLAKPSCQQTGFMLICTLLGFVSSLVYNLVLKQPMGALWT
jgi:hypothetical protein